MGSKALIQKAEISLRKLCVDIPTRPVGSEWNRQATAFTAAAFEEFGFITSCPEFPCLDWESKGATCRVGADTFAVFPSPYGNGCQVSGPLVTASTLAELEAAPMNGSLLLLRGELTKEQLMAKNFPFYNPEEHQHMIQMLEKGEPAAILTATTQNPELAGAMYPFPMIEDGDFNIPSAYMTEEEGLRLASHSGKTVWLEILSRRIPSTACNVIARKGSGNGKRVVLSAHIDSKMTTPGALDNAAGVVILLVLSDLLRDYQGRLGVELLVVNGEDYYGANGELQYLASHPEGLKDVLLNINLDGVGYRDGETAFSLYECTDEIARQIRKVFSRHAGLIEGEPWYQSDHMVFVQNGVPAAALTTAQFSEVWSRIAHTDQDTFEIVNPAILVQVAEALKDLLGTLNSCAAAV